MFKTSKYFQDQFFKRPFSAISDEELVGPQFSNDTSFIKSLEVGGKALRKSQDLFSFKDDCQ